jgi:protein-L-isoaspartate O-methyltransferase
VSSVRELHEELARVDASIAVLERIETLSERARADLAALRARRAEIAAALDALGGSSE